MAQSVDDNGDHGQETGSAFREALETFKRKLSERNFQRLEGISSRDVKFEIIRIQRDQERLKAMLNFRRMEEFIVKTEELQTILTDFLHADAGHYISYVWGAMRFLLMTASSTFTDGLDSLLSAYQQLGQKMPSFQDCSQLFTRHTGMRKCLSALYKDILDFHAGAYQCFTQFTERARKKIFKSAWKDFDHEISALEHNMQAHKGLVDLGARILEYQRSIGEQGVLSSENISKLSEQVYSYEGKIADRANMARKADSERHTKEFDDTINWISAGLNETHADRCNVRAKYPKTCDWIMNNDAVDNWMNTATPTHSILWINGSMGAGKSTLASYLVDRCIESNSVGAPFSTIYFYCNGKDPDSSTCLEIFKGLLHQQLMKVQENTRFRHLVAYCHDKKAGSGQQRLNTDDAARSLLDTFFDVIPHQYIIIDGLDECEKPEIRLALSLLTAVVARQDNTEPGRLRLLVVSRDITEIRRPLSAEGTTASTVKIEVDDNKGAISTYIEMRLKEFNRKLSLSTSELELVRDITCRGAKGAHGMFLFAELVLDNLQQCIQKEALLAKLKTNVFPKTLGEAYERIIEGLRVDRSSERWEKTKAIFGWLICAGRILRWHEIQAIVSIERHHQSVEFQQKKFITDVQELCGTLVHVKPGNKVELIHHTAHEYILANCFVDKAEVQFDLATLCMQYLTFPCFEMRIAASTRKEFAKDGFYAFQDYAVSKWFYHIAEVVRISPELLRTDAEKINAGKCNKFATVLDDFIHRYQDSIDDQEPAESEGREFSLTDPNRVKVKEIEDAAEKECESVRDARFYPMLLKLWIHISKHEKENIDDRNKPSLREMEITLNNNRKVIEELVHMAKGEEAEALAEYYGKNVFKCSRTRCGFFYEGFENGKKRDHHINRHNRPFECTIPGCGIAELGFISGKDLEKHKKNYHVGLTDEPPAFPQLSKKKNNDARFDCKLCGQKFTRKINLTGHTRNHFGERPFGCQNCGKKFTRVNDLRRHEKLHLRK